MKPKLYLVLGSPLRLARYLARSEEADAEKTKSERERNHAAESARQSAHAVTRRHRIVTSWGTLALRLHLIISVTWQTSIHNSITSKQYFPKRKKVERHSERERARRSPQAVTRRHHIVTSWGMLALHRRSNTSPRGKKSRRCREHPQ
jgi:hypothetical protein